MKRIKKHSNGSEYVLTNHGLWVRNFVKAGLAKDINQLTNLTDYKLLVQNETNNLISELSNIDSDILEFPNIVIVSDGFEFAKHEQLLKKLPSNVAVLGVNRSLVKWTGVRNMDYFIVNNPYAECLSQVPRHRYYPKCIVSTRTNPQFIRHYKRFNVVYKYVPVSEESFAPVAQQSIYQIDDYRNPICAAIGLAYRFGVEKLLLFCCDDTFAENRPGAEKLPNGLFMYSQQWLVHELVEANLLWLRTQELTKVKIGNFSRGPEYKNIPYINNVEEFFS